MCGMAVTPLPNCSQPLHKLTVSEISNPYLVIEDLFDCCHLPEWRQLLWSSFKSNITGTYHKELNRRERNEVVYLYEYLERLVEAAWVLHEKQRSATAPTAAAPVLYPVAAEHIHAPAIDQLCASAGCPATDMKAIVHTIARLTHADHIYCIGLPAREAGGCRYDLLALLPGNTPISFREYQAAVEAQCSAHGPVTLWCAHTGAVGRLLQEGHLFYSTACTAGQRVYDNQRVALPAPEGIDVTAVVEKARAVFAPAFTLAASFLDAARHHGAQGQLNMAAFLLHQAAEHALRAPLLAIAGYNSYRHDLAGLLRRYRCLSPAVHHLFPQDTDREKQLFHLLNSAYRHTRYKSNYTITAGDLALLLDRVAELHGQVRQGFQERVGCFASRYGIASRATA